MQEKIHGDMNPNEYTSNYRKLLNMFEEIYNDCQKLLKENDEV